MLNLMKNYSRINFGLLTLGLAGLSVVAWLLGAHLILSNMFGVTPSWAAHAGSALFGGEQSLGAAIVLYAHCLALVTMLIGCITLRQKKRSQAEGFELPTNYSPKYATTGIFLASLFLVVPLAKLTIYLIF